MRGDLASGRALFVFTRGLTKRKRGRVQYESEAKASRRSQPQVNEGLEDRTLDCPLLHQDGQERQGWGRPGGKNMTDKTKCAECHALCGFGRPIPFGSYACSAVCEMVLVDYLDGCGVSETESLVAACRRDSERLRMELQQRGIKP